MVEKPSGSKGVDPLLKGINESASTTFNQIGESTLQALRKSVNDWQMELIECYAGILSGYSAVPLHFTSESNSLLPYLESFREQASLSTFALKELEVAILQLIEMNNNLKESSE